MSASDTHQPSGMTRSRIALIAGIIAVIAIPLMTIGRYADLWSPVNAIPSLLSTLISVVSGLVAIILGLIGIVRRSGHPWSGPPVRLSLAAVALGLIMTITVGMFLAGRMGYPVIHDATTDTKSPPVFVALQAERDAMGAPNSTTYDPTIAAEQERGFPDLGPIILRASPDEAFNTALHTAKAMGWRIAATESSDGRIEAVATTFWSGYLDDIVIRITAVGEEESRVDIRSVSRVGGGDLGANGLRVRKFTAELRQAAHE